MTRARGFLYGWEPNDRTAELIGTVNDILSDNIDILPLTLRQIFYMLVSNHGFDKTEKAYKRLCENMNKARRASLVPMSSIRDDGLTRLGNAGWESEEALVDGFKSSAAYFTFDRQAAQAVKLFIWCEAAGMAPQLAAAVDEYHIPVLSSGGFDSVTTKHNVARQLSRAGKAAVLHLGDHDPSGVHMFSSLDEDLQAFLGHYGGEVELYRLAVTPDQVAEMDLPTAPRKPTDNRSFEGETTQCEAIPPRTLREIVRAEVIDRLDMEAHNAVLAEEQEIRARLIERLADL